MCGSKNFGLFQPTICNPCLYWKLLNHIFRETLNIMLALIRILSVGLSIFKVPFLTCYQWAWQLIMICVFNYLFFFTLLYNFQHPNPRRCMRIKGFQVILRKASPWTIVCTVLPECFARYTLNTSFTDFEKKVDTLQPLQKT